MALIGIDVGGTGIKVLSFAENGHLLSSQYREYSTITGPDGRAELDAELILQYAMELIATAARESGEPVQSITASSMGECFVCLDAENRILSNSITYHDKRGKESFAAFVEHFSPEKIDAVLGGMSCSYVQSVHRLPVLQQAHPDVLPKTRRICFLSDFILYMLGSEHCCDYSIAYTAGCFDPSTLDWHKEFIEWYGVDPSVFPRPVKTGACIGTISSAIAAQLGISADAKLVIGANDQLSSSIGSDVCHEGQLFNAIGTLDALRTFTDSLENAKAAHQSGLFYEMHYYSGKYVINPGAVKAGGVMLKWFRDHFYAKDAGPQLERKQSFYDYYSTLLPSAPTEILVLWPFIGTNEIGTVTNLTLGTRNESIYRAFMEGETFSVKQQMSKLTNAGFNIEQIVTIGGGARSDAFMQIRADIFNKPVFTLNYAEPGAFANAVLGGVAIGVYRSATEIVRQVIRVQNEFMPNPEHVAFYEKQYEKYNRLLEAILHLNNMEKGK